MAEYAKDPARSVVTPTDSGGHANLSATTAPASFSGPPRTVMDAILRDGDDHNFRPALDEDFQATGAPPGTREKLEVLAARVRAGQPLFHEGDRLEFSGGADDSLPEVRLKKFKPYIE